MQFILLTPAQQVADVQATYIAVPGEEGDFGVLPGHMQLVSTLRPGGTISVNLAEGGTATYTVTAGVAEVSPGKVTILAENLVA